MFRALWNGVRAIVLSCLLAVFVFLVCLCHPIFVLTTAISFSITFTNLGIGFIKRKLGRPAEDLSPLWQSAPAAGEAEAGQIEPAPPPPQPFGTIQQLLDQVRSIFRETNATL